MTNALFYAHSGLRYVVLLLAAAAIAYHAYGLATRRPVDRAARGTAGAFAGALDLQILLGVALMASGIFYGALMGHLMMMVLAAVAAHGGILVAKKAVEPRRYYTATLAGMVVAIVLIVLGVSAIGRSLFQSGVPSVVG